MTPTMAQVELAVARTFGIQIWEIRVTQLYKKKGGSMEYPFGSIEIQHISSI